MLPCRRCQRTSRRSATSKVNRTISTTIPPRFLVGPGYVHRIFLNWQSLWLLPPADHKPLSFIFNFCSGVFDTLEEKCPLGHSMGHGQDVTGRSHAFLSTPSTISSTNIPLTKVPTMIPSSSPTLTKNINIPKYPSFTACGPLPTPPGASSPPSRSSIQIQLGARGSVHVLTHDHAALTPPTTPPTFTSSMLGSNLGHYNTLLRQLFPHNVHQLQGDTTGLTIESPQPDGTWSIWDGFILEQLPVVAPTAAAAKGTKARASVKAAPPTYARTLYISIQNAFRQQDRIRECIVALLDLASEHLDCEAVVMVLEREMCARADGGVGGIPDAKSTTLEFGELLHSLMYVGGVVVTNPPFAVDPRFVLVGIEI